MLCRMEVPAPDQTATCVSRPWVKEVVVKATVLTLLGLFLALGYGWAKPRFYRPERVAGFGVGMLHGALMPMALPTLLIGEDAPIYAPNNAGRIYKLGYIAGINLCGLLFFGFAFRRPRKR
jgi:hypothetical protein